MDAAIVINVNEARHVYQRGPLGTFIVPGTDENGFGILVVREDAETQDVGNMVRKKGKAIPGKDLARDILGSEGEKMGLLICEADVEVPRDLERAEREERDFLDQNPGELKSRYDAIKKMHLFRNLDEPDIAKKKEKLSQRVQDERRKFANACRKLVTKDEIAKAERNLTAHRQMLVKEGDRLWAREQTKGEVNEHHKAAAVALGYEPPWNYTPGVKVDCPGCGEKVKKGVATCGHCGAILDEAAAKKLYPERFAVAKAS